MAWLPRHAVDGVLPVRGDVGDAGAFQFLLGFADRGDFGAGVNDVRDHVVVHVPGLTGNDLGSGDAFIFGFVREHRPGDHIANGVDAFYRCREMRIDLHTAAIVEGDTGFL